MIEPGLGAVSKRVSYLKRYIILAQKLCADCIIKV